MHRGVNVRPADPFGSPELDEARRRLRAMDDRLDLWWCPRNGRWRVMEYMKRQGVWSFVFYWQGPNGEYRGPSPVEPMLEKLAECDWSKYVRYGKGGMANAVDRDLSTFRERVLKDRARRFNELRQEMIAELQPRSAELVHNNRNDRIVNKKWRAYEAAREELAEEVLKVKREADSPWIEGEE